MKKMQFENIFQCGICKTKVVIDTEGLSCPKCGSFRQEYGDILDLSGVEIVSERSSTAEQKTHKYVFVFTEPLNKTDIQYHELYHLIKAHSLKTGIIRSAYDNRAAYENGFEHPLSSNCTVEIYAFENSCYVKSLYEIDIKSIVRESGYVQSAGKYIYIDKWSDIEDINRICERIKEYSLETKKKYDIRFYFDVEHKDFPTKIDNITIDHQRTYIGNKILYGEKAAIESDLKVFYQEYDLKNDGGVIFIYKDTKHEKPDRFTLYTEQNDDHYMVIYHSVFKKENPLHLLDESRPYWAGIYTTPHNLTCAMVNMAQIAPGDIVYDPFMHMGTTAIEAAKFDCRILSSDLSEPIGGLDNFNFAYHSDLKKVNERLRNLIESEYYNECLEIIGNNIHKKEESVFPDAEPVEKLIEKYPILKQFEERLLFYILRRYELRKMQGIKEENTAKAYALRFIDYDKIFDKFHDLSKITRENMEGWPPDPSVVNDFSYRSLRIGPQKHPSSTFTVFKANARIIPIQTSSISAIITDPPYGYGDDVPDIRGLYQDFLKEAFRILKSGGRLVMCTLDKVKTGKRLDPEITTFGVIGLIEKITEERKISLVRKDIIPVSTAKNINYWKSKHALNRAIINLEIIKNDKSL